MTFNSVSVSVEDGVGSLVLNRPHKSNAVNKDMWTEIPEALRQLVDMDARAVRVLAASPSPLPASGRLWGTLTWGTLGCHWLVASHADCAERCGQELLRWHRP